MEIVRVVLLVAVSTAVAALMLYVFGGWPKALPYGEPMPYITFKNTTRGIQLGVFDYSNASVTAHIYVNGRYAGSGRGWTDVYVKCGDYVEALFQYNGFARKVEGRISCSKPLRSSAVTTVFGSRTALEAIAAFSSLGIEITTECVERVDRRYNSYVYTYYPVFNISSRNSIIIEYQTGGLRFVATGVGSYIRIDTGGVNTFRGFLRSYTHPPYGYTISDFKASRNLPVNFIVKNIDTKYHSESGYFFYFRSTKGYVEIDGEQYELATCEYTDVKVKIRRVAYTYRWIDINTLDPDAIYEVLIVSPSGNVYRQTFAFYPNNTALRITTTKVEPPPSIVMGTCANVEIGDVTYTMCGSNLGDAFTAFQRFVDSARKTGMNVTAVYNEMKNAIAAGEGYDKTFGNTVQVTRRIGEVTNIYVEVILSRDVKTDSLSKGFTWIAMPGVFKGLTAGGWDVFINMAPNKIVMNSTTPPIVLNFIR